MTKIQMLCLIGVEKKVILFTFLNLQKITSILYSYYKLNYRLVAYHPYLLEE